MGEELPTPPLNILKNGHLCMLRSFKMLVTKFFSLGQSFICIALVVLRLNQKIAHGVGSVPPPPPLKLREGLMNRALQLNFPVKLHFFFISILNFQMRLGYA